MVMNKIILIALGVIVLVAILSGVYTFTNTPKDASLTEDTQQAMRAEKENGEKETMEKEQMNTEEEMKKEDMLKRDESVMKDDMMKDVSVETTLKKVGSYEAYAPEKLARAESGAVVLFFHASWCPSCRGLNADIEANLSTIPEGVSILKVDYDKETELKKKYGVTYQHTLVQVDAQGNQIKKWSGSPKLSNVLAELNKL